MGGHLGRAIEAGPGRGHALSRTGFSPLGDGGKGRGIAFLPHRLPEPGLRLHLQSPGQPGQRRLPLSESPPLELPERQDTGPCPQEGAHHRRGHHRGNGKDPCGAAEHCPPQASSASVPIRSSSVIRYSCRPITSSRSWRATPGGTARWRGTSRASRISTRSRCQRGDSRRGLSSFPSGSRPSATLRRTESGEMPTSRPTSSSSATESSRALAGKRRPPSPAEERCRSSSAARSQRDRGSEGGRGDGGWIDMIWLRIPMGSADPEKRRSRSDRSKQGRSSALCCSVPPASASGRSPYVAAAERVGYTLHAAPQERPRGLLKGTAT
jgi:hypothetical protein